MQVFNTHIISKFFLEVNTTSKQKGYYLKDNINTFLKEELFPLLQTYFDTIDKKMQSKNIQIESLKMDLSINPDLDFNTIKLEIIDQFQKQISKQIETDFSDTKNYSVLSNKEKEINEFFSFLETGTNVWWLISRNTIESQENQFEKIIGESAFASKLSVALKNSQTRIRFIKQLSDNQIYIIIKKTFLAELTNETTLKNIKRIKQNLNDVIYSSKLKLHQRNLIWEIILLKLLQNNENKIKEKLISLIVSFTSVRKYNLEFVLQHLNRQVQNKSVLSLLGNLENEILNLGIILEQKASEKLSKNNALSESNLLKREESCVSNHKKNEAINSIFNTKEEDGILNTDLSLNQEIVIETASDYYGNNAGLLLIHPFLKKLFENCKLLNQDNSITDPEAAAHLLHYIATAKEQDYEAEMVFEKFLCNIPVKQSINRNIILSEEVKNSANKMLDAVLENWTIMKNSSVALLQNEYLQRPGKIILTAENPKILVERKTQDILLDKITWNLSIVKLAWKNKIIYVEW